MPLKLFSLVRYPLWLAIITEGFSIRMVKENKGSKKIKKIFYNSWLPQCSFFIDWCKQINKTKN